MRSSLFSLLLTLALALVVRANVEKSIFFGAQDSDQPHLRAWRKQLIEDGIEVVTPEKNTLRRKIHAAWPDSPSLGVPNRAWILLDNLEPWRWYELRLSFSAMQPSTQNISTLDFNLVYPYADRKEDVTDYMISRKAYKLNTPAPEAQPGSQQAFFYIAVDPNFFTIDKQLMKDGMLVEFDFILDPYYFGFMPRSQIKTTIYITILTCIALPLSGLVWRSLLYVGRLETETRARPEDQIKDD